MTDQTTKIQPAMIHVDLSKVLPPTMWDYATAFLPGLFFEVSVALANRPFVNTIAANLPKSLPLNQYAKLQSHYSSHS